MYRLNIFCTNRCNLACPHCTTRPFRDLAPDYDMSLAELAHLIARCQALGVKLQWATFTGGEPAVWPHLVEGLKRIADSGIAAGQYLATNAVEPGPIAAGLEYLQEIRLSLYPTNAKAVERFYRQHVARPGLSIGIWAEPHRRPPTAPVAHSLPAGCCCAIAAYHRGRIYTCPGALNTAPALNRPLDDPAISCSVDDDFGVWYAGQIPGRFYQAACTLCLANVNVWNAAAETELPRPDFPAEIPVTWSR